MPAIHPGNKYVTIIIPTLSQSWNMLPWCRKADYKNYKNRINTELGENIRFVLPTYFMIHKKCIAHLLKGNMTSYLKVPNSLLDGATIVHIIDIELF